MSIPYFPMYPADFEADTSHLTLEEDGAYNRLLRLMWMTPGCSLPDDPAWVQRRMRVDYATFERVVAPLIAEFLCRKGGRIISVRLREEFEKADETYRKRSEAGKKGGRPQAIENKQNGQKAGLSQSKAGPKQPEPEPEPYKKEREAIASSREGPSRFDEFWASYPHRNGAKKGRKTAEAKYAAAVKRGAGEDEIIAGALRYHGDRGVIDGYARDPTTWLNAAGWQDEIEVRENGTKGAGNGSTSKGDARMRAFLDGARGASGMDRGADIDPSRPLLARG